MGFYAVMKNFDREEMMDCTLVKGFARDICGVSGTGNGVHDLQWGPC